MKKKIIIVLQSETKNIKHKLVHDNLNVQFVNFKFQVVKITLLHVP